MKHCRLYFQVDAKVVETEKAMSEVPFYIPLRTWFSHLNIPIIFVPIMQKKKPSSANVLFVNYY